MKRSRVPYRDMSPSVVDIILAKYNGKEAAFVEYRDTKELFGLAVVVKDEEGYSPVPIQLVCGTEQDMRQDAAKLNRKFLDLQEPEAARIVASSMRTVADGRKSRRATVASVT